VRTLCPACKQADEPVSGETLSESIKPWRLNGQFRPYKPVGCLDCRMTGFKGRVGLYELLPVSEAVRDALHPQVDMTQLRKTAAKEGLRPLRLSGIMKVTEGLTTVEEVLRNTPQWER
jgi:general secretion pathway protein E